MKEKSPEGEGQGKQNDIWFEVAKSAYMQFQSWGVAETLSWQESTGQKCSKDR